MNNVAHTLDSSSMSCPESLMLQRSTSLAWQAPHSPFAAEVGTHSEALTWLYFLAPLSSSRGQYAVLGAISCLQDSQGRGAFSGRSPSLAVCATKRLQGVGHLNKGGDSRRCMLDSFQKQEDGNAVANEWHVAGGTTTAAVRLLYGDG